MHLQLGLYPGTHWGSLQHSPDPLAGFGGRSGDGREGNEVGKATEGREEPQECPQDKFL